MVLSYNVFTIVHFYWLKVGTSNLFLGLALTILQYQSFKAGFMDNI